MKSWIFSLCLLVCLSFPGVPCASPSGVTVTVYTDDLAMVRQVRTMHLVQGVQEYRFDQVAPRIDSTSVRFRSLTAPGAVLLEEQYLALNPASTDELLKRYLNHKIVVTLDGGEACRGTLLATQAGDAILRLEDGSIQAAKARAIASLQFPAMPDDLARRPTLVWRIRCTKPGKHKVEISYLTRGMSWRAEYAATFRESEDRIELAGWASLENRAGLTFQDARVQLVAGEVHRGTPPPTYRTAAFAKEAMVAGARPPSRGFKERPLFAYHLYSLDRPATLEDGRVKQLPLFPATTLKAKKEFSYDGARDKDKVRVNLVFRNTREEGLGRPLPAGRVRVYKAAEDGEPIFIGEDRLGALAEQEEARLYLGNAFDIVGERTVIETRQISKRSRQETVEIRLRNHRDTEARVTVIEHFSGDWRFIGKTPPIKKKEAARVEFDLHVPGKGEKRFTYQVLTRW